jgi:GGDEF domain-containing protein
LTALRASTGYRWLATASKWASPPGPAAAVTPPGACPTSESPRARRFALPEMHDPRTDAAIDALLAGRARRRGRPDATPWAIDAARHPLEGLISRVAWAEALEREGARVLRYGHVASMVVFELAPLSEPGTRDGWIERLAGPVAHAIRRGARETDLITRAAPGRFLVLLPETTETEASRFADRVLRDIRVWLEAMGAPIGVRAAASAAAAGDGGLEVALERGQELLRTG